MARSIHKARLVRCDPNRTQEEWSSALFSLFGLLLNPNALFKLEDGFYVLRNVKVVFRFVDSERDHEVEARAKVVHFLGRGPRARLPLKKRDE
ncbi:hypothetical protein H5410_022648 [Solanum commersonii]|uniref:Uncharacterized protein n=1 Tax=Solanum commersonii TaxID=4109 RepID=A0A9J5ZHE2_SOLCO|nr:hypothetical protein H5410_022648 [Solanum commersonii]